MNLNTLPTLRVKIADTFESQARGLMFVKSMPRDCGMLFVFSSNRKLSFWGENTFIPLDIAFVNDRGRVVNIETISPLSKKSVSSSSPCQFAVEANLGFFQSNGIKPGDMMVFNKNTSMVSFAKRDSKEPISSLRLAQQMTDEEMLSKFPTLSDYFNHLDSQSQQPQQPQQPQQIEETNLPVLSQDEIGQYIEDSIQEQQDMQQEDGLAVEEPPSPEDAQEQEQESLEDLQQRIPTFGSVSEAFNWAQENKEVMKISYQTKSKKKGLRFFGNNVITRYIEPHGRFTSHPENEPSHEILVTFDETVGGIRAFRMQNVREFSIVGKKFNPKFIVR
jgi:uncharacterized membrane protein (UPF0127 family)